jgi:fructose-1,6-bisphosphatase III
MAYSFDPGELALLQALSARYPTADAALAEAAALRAGLSLPKGTVHVISDVHGEDRKLRHVINNASGSLRPLVESMFAGKLSAEDQRSLLNVLYYPREAIQALRPQLADLAAQVAWVKRLLRLQFDVVRALAAHYRSVRVTALFPDDYAELFEELYDEPCAGRGQRYVDAMIDALADHGGELEAVRSASRLVRNLSVAETIVAGDLGDRGPRIDRVIEYLMRQPHVSVVWGNHDVSWMGACLGQPALIATVVRFSLRYGRTAQLEEGYGIPLDALEDLARAAYADDPAERFKVKVKGSAWDESQLARMQKAIAVLQLKLEAQTSRRHPEWGMEGRNLLHRIDRASGTVEVDGKTYPLLDRNLPTVNPEDPYRLSPAEQTCIDRLREAFVTSSRLWQHMSWVVRRGAMWLKRDDALIFHACVPVDEQGHPLALEIDGKSVTGRAQMDAIDSVIRRAFRKGAEGLDTDADWLWYLWAGPKSPLFGKDKMATFEGHFVADKEIQHEHKNAYFTLIHDAAFVRRIGAEFGMGDDVMVVNGHVPVKVEKGEQPVKRGGNAVTIDGAFSEAYGDRGYTLILSAEGIKLAEHHHFESVQQVITAGADIVPHVAVIQSYPRPRTVGDTDEGEAVRRQAHALERLILAYHEGAIPENSIR